MFRTSDGRLAVIMMTFLLYVACPVVFWLLMKGPLERDVVSSAAATPLSPFMLFIFLWFIGLPVVVVFCGMTEILGRKYYGSDN